MNFFELLYKNQVLPNGYSTIGYLGNKGILHLDVGTLTPPKIGFGSFILVPDYLEYTLAPEYRLKKIKQANLGYAINLQDYDNVKDYVKAQYKTDANKIIKRHDRLYLCFAIHYKVFGEEISKEEYEFLMVYLKQMLVDRFEQRNDKNKNLSNWSVVYSSLYHELQIGKALLFVMYSDEKPIQITVTYKLQKVLFSSIPAYDIDYSKFGLGNTAIYKQIEWCLQYGFKIVEMGYGDLDYKKRWSNLIYGYHHHILYATSDTIAKIKAFLFFEMVLLKEYLKRRNLKTTYTKLATFFSFKQSKMSALKPSAFESQVRAASSEARPTTPIDIEGEAYAFLRKHVYDFQYVQLESSQNIQVFRIDAIKNTFIVKGSKNELELAFKNSPEH
jgi:arginyl-tRNA--protein-N-Asp/Glu arginylyltransferase